MWYGGTGRICNRGEQARQAYSVIKNLNLDSNIKFEQLRKLGIDKVVAARILHLIHNKDFGVEEYYE